MRKLALLVLVACGSKTHVAPPPPPPTPIDAAPIDAVAIEPVVVPVANTAAELWLYDCRGWIDEARAARVALVDPWDGRTVENTVEMYNDMLISASGAADRASLFQNVHPDPAVREAARTCELEVSAFVSAALRERAIYDALTSVDVSAMDAAGKRFVERALRDFRHQGVDLDEATRARLQVLSDEMTAIGQEFDKNIAEDVRAITVLDEQRLAGLPQEMIDAHRGADGSFTFTTDYPDYYPFVTYVADDELKRQLYVLFRSRGDAHNDALLRDLLTRRREYATLLGFQDWADYVAADQMMGSGANAAKFLARVTKLAKKRGDKDYKELLAQQRKRDPKAKRVEDWQKTMLEQQVKLAKYDVDSNVVRAYFPYQQTLEGLLSITGKIYDLQYVRVTDASVWAPDVAVYDVMRGADPLGRIYLDMHPREGKYKHAAQFGVVEGIPGRQLPEGALVCNFPAGDEPMEHGDVVTMFHEFGHLMHHVLSSHHWITQTGTAVEHDFVEAPSQMFEEWAWSYETLATFAKNAQGEVIPKALVAKMRKADGFGLGTRTLQQLFYAALSLGLHTADPATVDPLALTQELQASYTPFAFVDGTKFYASFGHLVGYSSTYYTYQWSLTIAKDMLSAFAKQGLLDLKMTAKYRDTILATGGTKDAAELVKDFLGRAWSYKAYEKYLKQYRLPHQVARDVLLVRLEGAAADLDQLGVAPELLDAVLRAVAVAAEDLDRRVGDLLGRGRAEQLRGVGAHAVARGRRHRRGDAVDQRAHRLDLRVRLAEVALDLAVLVDRLAEAVALLRVPRHRLEAALADAEAHRREAEPLDLEVAHHVGDAAALGAEEVVARDAAAVEDQLGHRRGAHAQLGDLRARREPGELALDDERRDAVVELGVDDEHVRFRAVGDERLAAVEDEVIAVAARDGLQAEDVGAHRRLGHAHRADMLAGQRLGQQPRALRRRGRPVEVVDEQQGVREVAEREPGVGPRELLVDDDRRHRVQAGAAVGLGDREPTQAEVTQLAKQAGVELA